MKITYYLFASVLCLAVAIGACNDGPTNVADEAELSVQENTAVSKKESKVDICHWDENGWDNLPDQTEPGAFFHLNINNNAWGDGAKKNPNDKDVGHNGHVKDQWYCFPGTNVDNNGEACTPESDREKITIDPGDQYNAVFCEEDSDGDSFSDDSDNCPDTFNPDQADTDVDGIGDLCDTCNDVDEDGYGDNAFGLDTCDLDCDDTDPAVNPGATEVCDGADNNCSGTTDEGGVCLYPTCQGDTWASVGNVQDFPCDPGQCSVASYCGEVFEGGGACVSLVTSTCGGGACPNGTSDCPAGSACVVNTLCGGPVCMTPAMLCEDPV